MRIVMVKFRRWLCLTLTLVGVSLLFERCNNKLDVLTTYKEIVVVYGLLDPGDTVHYIKVNKAFLGPGNALTMAQQGDSLTFKNKVTVQLQAYSAQFGNIGAPIVLKADSSVPKNPGLFSYPKQVLYSTRAKLDSSLNYNLTVLENGNPVAVTGSTALITGVQTVTEPSSYYLVFSKPDSVPFTVAWLSVNGAKIYQVALRFYYVEQNKLSGVSVNKSLDWVLPLQVAPYTQGNNYMQVAVPGSAFYQFLASQLQPNSAVRRFVRQKAYNRNFDILFSAGTQDLYTYIEISQPSTSITQNPPQFTNVQNGFGLFTARNVQVYNAAYGYYIAGSTIDSLYNGRFTKGLFCDSVPLSPYYCN